jgi:hypothetical protein
MARSRSVAALAAALTLALPGAALAGGAGENQYQDPFSTSEPQTTPAPAPSQTPAASPQAPSTPAAQPSPTATTADGSGQLPRTGFDVRMVGGAGLLLVAAGMVIRRRLT